MLETEVGRGVNLGIFAGALVQIIFSVAGAGGRPVACWHEDADSRAGIINPINNSFAFIITYPFETFL